MKKKACLLLGALLATSLIAQTTTNAPHKTETKPAAKDSKKTTKKTTAKPAAKKPSLADQVKSIPLVPGTATVVASNVNVRARAGLIGEVLTKITKGSTVTVIEEITLKNSKDDEPSAWAKINLPPGARVFVNTGFIDAATKTVKPKKLNLRGGAGENYSVIGTLEKGAAVKEIAVKGDWTEIEPPAGAFAFVAAQYLQQSGSPAIVATTPTPTPPPATNNEPPPTTAAVTEPAAVAPPTSEPPAVAVTPTPTNEAPAVATSPITGSSTNESTEPVVEEPLPPRIISHEGIVKGTTSIQAPTRFALVNPETGKTINYLFTTSTNLDLRRYKGLQIVVTGEEGLDERWRNTPVITIQRIQVVQ